MPKGGNNSNLLPSVLSSLKSKYLSTLFNALYASEEPFDHFTKTSPMFLKTSHQAFESVWPHLKIQVETDDIMYNIVSSHCFHGTWSKNIYILLTGLPTCHRKTWEDSRCCEGSHRAALYSGRVLGK